MIYYLVVGLCIFLLVLVIFIAAKPISMGIEARRNIKDNKTENFSNSVNSDYDDQENINLEKNSITDEIIKLNKLKNDGIITDEEYKKAKDKLLN
ncbi:SHOCT domain-containing protein [Candidatus Pelagibacter sp.]|nr:SHOCT domain-containing protein [Candidatus Pelagibacter sp.]